MAIPMTAPQVLDREFLEIRAKVLELAASFDRLERAGGGVENDPRLVRIYEALAVLDDPAPAKAERVQLIFSRAYEENWQQALAVRRPR